MVAIPGWLLSLLVQLPVSHSAHLTDFIQIPWLCLSVIGVRSSRTSS
jgi:hypothetical protein